MSNNKRIWITIDTEMDADIHWNKKWPPEYSSILDGIPQFYRPLWDKYDVHPIYFLSPEILYSEECCEVFRDEIKKGAIIGAHLHPEYIEPQRVYYSGKQIVQSEFPCSAYDYDTEYNKIKNLTLLIEEKLAIRPIWYRAARFGADNDTMKILEQLGYKYDSSVTPYIDWSDRGGKNFSNYPQEDITRGTSIVEKPVYIDGKRFGKLGEILPDNWLFYNWLRPTHMTLLELNKIIREQSGSELLYSNNNFENTYDEPYSDLVMMFHSMEIMINKTPYVRNKIMQKYYLYRLENTLKLAQALNFIL